jgi:hypothetical protein
LAIGREAMEGVAGGFGGVGGAKPYLVRVYKRDHGKKFIEGPTKSSVVATTTRGATYPRSVVIGEPVVEVSRPGACRGHCTNVNCKLYDNWKTVQIMT